MCDTHDGRAADILIGIESPDGTVYTRTWHVCPAKAGQLADLLGTPVHQSIADLTAQRAIADAMLAAPGLVMHGDAGG